MKHPIYLTLLLLLTGILVSLPLVKVPISVSARGIIRPLQEDTEITAPVSGRVVRSFLCKNNQSFHKGDTLLVVTTELLDTQRELLATQTIDYKAQLTDLSSLTSGTEKPLLTAQYQQE
ncbi:MAG: secretion protein HlyD, partial [Capnocytophaga sp.]